MTKKNKKKNQKASQSSAPPQEPSKKKEAELDMLEDIKRDEDLYISESDVANISNFIRTTNKSFNSLGNTVLEKFNGRCSLAILHALLTLFDTDSEDREDVIRRLNIIYIVWRLPEIEAELRSKPQKNMNDVYSHPFSTFLFYAEQLVKFELESMLARIIVTNNVAMIEKFTAPDFMQKAKSLKVAEADLEAWNKYEIANTDHWPEITEEMVSLSKAMRELGCFSERKDHEAGMAEAFYPLVHKPPTMLPPRMIALDSEDPTMAAYRREKDKQDQAMRAAEVFYSLTAGDDIQEKIKEAFQDLQSTIGEYQAEINSGMTNAELHEAHREITYKAGEMEASSDSEVYTDTERDSDESELEEERLRAEEMLRPIATFNENIIEGCTNRILIGHALTTSKTDYMLQFIGQCLMTHPQYQRLLIATETDDNVVLFARTNTKFAASFLSRNALAEQGGANLLFYRYIRICYQVQSPVQSFDVVMKLGTDFYEAGRLEPELKEKVLTFVRDALTTCEQQHNASARSVRLVAMLVRKLLQGEVVKVEDISADVKPFCLRNTHSRECTTLYEFITGLQAGTCTPRGGGEQPTTDSITTTTTTTTSVASDSTTTTTTTTVVKTCGPAVIKQTSRKVVLQASSFKTLDKMKKSAQAMFAKGIMTPTKATGTVTVLPAGASSSSSSSSGGPRIKLKMTTAKSAEKEEKEKKKKEEKKKDAE